MAGFNRAAHCKRIAAAGGRSTVARHGAAHMSAIGKAGFAKAVELGYGVYISSILSPSYEAKFGKPIRLSMQSREAAAIRAAARDLFGGMICDRCAAAPGQVHHIEGLRCPDPNAPSRIAILCDRCHRAEHRQIRREHREGRRA